MSRDKKQAGAGSILQETETQAQAEAQARLEAQAVDKVIITIATILENIIEVVSKADSGYLNANRDGITPINSINCLKAVHFFSNIVEGKGDDKRYFLLGDVVPLIGKIPTVKDLSAALALVVEAHKAAGEASYGFMISPAVGDDYVKDCYLSGGGSKSKAARGKGGIWLIMNKAQSTHRSEFTSFADMSGAVKKMDKFTALLAANKARQEAADKARRLIAATVKA
jgi:hypothetical protein